MCRWLAYSGSPVLIEELLYTPKHSLIDQSLHSTMGAETTNGDGFGIGWYGDHETPGTFHSVEPAWSDRNLRDLAAHVRQADVVVAAVGRRGTVTADMVKPGAVVIDVGMNRDDAGKLCGDVDFTAVAQVAGAITPVPGGVGPMTRAMLLVNTVEAAERAAEAAV